MRWGGRGGCVAALWCAWRGCVVVAWCGVFVVFFLVFVWFVGLVWPLGRSLLADRAGVCGGVRFGSSAGFGLGRSRLAGLSGWALSVGGGVGRCSRLWALLGGGVFLVVLLFTFFSFKLTQQRVREVRCTFCVCACVRFVVCCVSDRAVGVRLLSDCWPLGWAGVCVGRVSRSVWAVGVRLLSSC